MEIILILLWLVAIIGCPAVASDKGRSAGGWFILGLLFGPLALLAIAVAGADRDAIARQKIASGSLRKCPACAEAVQREAIRCRHCAEPLTPLVPEPKAPSPILFFGGVLVVMVLLAMAQSCTR